MRWRAATLLLSAAVLALVVAFSRDVSVPHQQQTDGHVSAHQPWLYSDSSGITVLCVSDKAAVLYPPIFHVVPVSAPTALAPLPSSNYTPPAVWGGP